MRVECTGMKKKLLLVLVASMMATVVSAHSARIKNLHFLQDDNDELDVSKKAVELLVLLVQADGEVVSSDTIKNRLWAAGQNASDGSLRVYITQLKKYFPEAIVNVRGVGYRWLA